MTITVFAEDLQAGDRLMPSGDRIEQVEAIPVGPDWIVAAWIEGADDYEVGQPTVTWGLDAEVEVEQG